MSKELALAIIFVISAVGIVFSGYLSYNELFLGYCGVGGCSKIGGFPACVYGCVMYLVVFIVSSLGLVSKK